MTRIGWSIFWRKFARLLSPINMGRGRLVTDLIYAFRKGSKKKERKARDPGDVKGIGSGKNGTRLQSMYYINDIYTKSKDLAPCSPYSTKVIQNPLSLTDSNS